MDKLKLKVDKIRKEMERLGFTERDVAKKMGTSQQLFNYWLNSGSLCGVKKIARALDFEPKDLIE